MLDVRASFRAPNVLDVRADLIAISYTPDGYGRRQAVEAVTSLYVAIKQVTRAEFVAAAQSGLRADVVLLAPTVLYRGQDIVDLTQHGQTVRYDIYRTYQVDTDYVELYCSKRSGPAAGEVFTFWCAGKVITIHGARLTGSNGASPDDIGMTSTSTVKLIVPQTVQAFCGATAVELVKPKAYAALTDKSGAWTLDSSSFFARGDISATGKYQEINSTYDDVYRVAGVELKTSQPGGEYLEITGK